MELIVHLAEELGVSVKQIHAVVADAGMVLIDLKSGNSFVRKALAEDDAQAVRMLVRLTGAQPKQNSPSQDKPSNQQGWFYVVQPVPAVPNQIKLGYTNNLNRRLGEYRSSCPYARIAAQWPCLRRWEKTAMDAMTFDCTQLGAEVYDVPDVGKLIQLGERFFGLLPVLVDSTNKVPEIK